jgi:hypothetical protein
MARDDSFIYSGMTSSVTRRLREKAQQEVSEKESLKGKIKPNAELVIEEVAKEKERIYKELAELPVNYDTKEESIKSYLLAQQMHLKFLETFQTSMLNKLRSHKRNQNG